jgi:F-type H+-transporting ATPase subunit c
MAQTVPLAWLEAPAQFPNLLLGFALAEATGLFGLVVALILLFVV